MINRNEMMGLLLTVCPRVKPLWSAFLEDWRDDGVDLPLYLFFGGIARLVSSLYQEGCENELRDIFLLSNVGVQRVTTMFEKRHASEYSRTCKI